METNYRTTDISDSTLLYRRSNKFVPPNLSPVYPVSHYPWRNFAGEEITICAIVPLPAPILIWRKWATFHESREKHKMPLSEKNGEADRYTPHGYAGRVSLGEPSTLLTLLTCLQTLLNTTPVTWSSPGPLWSSACANEKRGRNWPKLKIEGMKLFPYNRSNVFVSTW